MMNEPTTHVKLQRIDTHDCINLKKIIFLIRCLTFSIQKSQQFSTMKFSAVVVQQFVKWQKSMVASGGMLSRVLVQVRQSVNKMRRISGDGCSLPSPRPLPVGPDLIYIVYECNYIYCKIWLTSLWRQVKDCRYSYCSLQVKSCTCVLNNSPLNKFGYTLTSSIKSVYSNCIRHNCRTLEPFLSDFVKIYEVVNYRCLSHGMIQNMHKSVLLTSYATISAKPLRYAECDLQSFLSDDTPSVVGGVCEESIFLRFQRNFCAL